MKYIILFIFFASFRFPAFSNGPGNIDSLQESLRHATSDSIRIRIYNKLIYSYTFLDPQKSIDLADEVIPFLDRSGKDHDWASFYNVTGIAYNLRGDYVKSIDHFLKALSLYEKNNDTLRVPHLLNNIGTIFEQIGNYPRAMDYFIRSLRLYETRNDKNAVAAITNNIGMLYEDKGELDSALYFHERSLSIGKEFHLADREADSHLNIGSILIKKKDYKRALGHLLNAYRLDRKNNNSSGIVETYAALGEAYLGLNQLPQAYQYLDTGLKSSLEKGTKDLTSRLYSDMAEYYSKHGDYASAYESLQKHMLLSDSLVNSETKRQIENLQLINENEQKAREISLLTQINSLKDDQIRSQKKYFALLFIIVLFLIVISILLWIYYKIKARANKMLSQHNEKISEKNAELETQSKKLQELSTEKDNMIGVVAHDLKSPLSKILGLSGLIRSGAKMQKDQVEYLDLIDKVIADANLLIARILDINKLESVGFETNLENVNLSQVMEETVNAFRKPADEKIIRIHLDCDPDTSCQTDRELISRVLDNLLSNAIKFSDRNKNIFLCCHKNNGHIDLSVRDEGPGIKKEEIPLLFKKYTRLSARPTAGESSTGLGLAIVDLIVSKLNGKIQVQSEPQKGTNFIISLPEN